MSRQIFCTLILFTMFACLVPFTGLAEDEITKTGIIEDVTDYNDEVIGISFRDEGLNRTYSIDGPLEAALMKDSGKRIEAKGTIEEDPDGFSDTFFITSYTVITKPADEDDDSNDGSSDSSDNDDSDNTNDDSTTDDSNSNDDTYSNDSNDSSGDEDSYGDSTDDNTGNNDSSDDNTDSDDDFDDSSDDLEGY